MKKILKKNQIIITALVVMVAIAGYLSMTDREELTMNGHGDHNKAATESAADISEEDIVLDEDEETADAASGKAVSTSGQKVSNKEMCIRDRVKMANNKPPITGAGIQNFSKK